MGFLSLAIGRPAAACLAALLLLCGGCVHTEPFLDEHGREVAGSVATMETLRIGGIDQHVWFRGIDTGNPALVLLSGGPGASEAALFRRFVAALERHYLVVYWEQRGAGRSYASDTPPESMHVARFVADLGELVQIVKARFGKGRVVLLAHSWGTVIGTRYAAEHPGDVSAYVAIAPVADTAEAARRSYRFALAQAERQHDRAAEEAIRAIGPAPRSVDDVLTLGRWVERFTVRDHATLTTLQLIRAALGTDEANLIDLVQFGRGNRFSLERLHDEIERLKPMERYRAFDVPVVFLLGRHDWSVPSVLSARWFERIAAPCKRRVWFERSGHNPPFDEPDAFVRVMTGEVLQLVKEGCGRRH